MPRGDKSAYTDKQKRQAEHIEEGYEHRGVPEGTPCGPPLYLPCAREAISSSPLKSQTHFDPI